MRTYDCNSIAQTLSELEKEAYYEYIGPEVLKENCEETIDVGIMEREKDGNC